MTQAILIAHNIRSTHNIGSLFRTAEGLGVEQIIISGYSPYPLTEKDSRLPHIAQRATSQISKTALGAERLVKFSHQDEPNINELKNQGYTIIGLEQATSSILLDSFEAPQKFALVIGEEVAGVDQKLLDQCDVIIEIPMRGQKESFNVSVAAAIALYELCN